MTDETSATTLFARKNLDSSTAEPAQDDTHEEEQAAEDIAAKKGRSKQLKKRIAEVAAKLERLRAMDRKLETGQKIIVGSLVIARALKEDKTRKWLARILREDTSREADKDRIAPLLEQLEEST